MPIHPSEFDPSKVVRVGGALGFTPEIYPCTMGPGGYPQWDKRICPYPGITYEYYHELLKFAGLKYEITPLHNLTKFVWGSKNETTGNWNAMFGLLQSGVVDTLFPNFVATEHRMVDFDYGLLLLARSTTDASTGYIKYSSAIWDTLSMVFDQHDGRYSEPTYSSKAIVLCIGFTVLFLHTLYEGYLVTMMLSFSTSGPFESMSQLAALVSKGQYKLVSYSETDSFMKNIQTVDTPAWRTMKDALAKNPAVYVNDVATMMDMIQKDGTLVHPGRFGIQALGLLANRCNLIFQPDEEAGSRVAFGQIYRRGSGLLTYLQPFHTKLGAEGGEVFITQLLDKYIQYERMQDSCVRSASGIQGPQPLNIKHYYGITIVSMIGLGTALLIFIIEKIHLNFSGRAYKKVAAERENTYVTSKIQEQAIEQIKESEDEELEAENNTISKL